MFLKRNLLIWMSFVLTAYILYKGLSSSLFFKKKDRVNLVFYGRETVFYSIGDEEANYFFPFSSDIEVLVPGGYGYYRVGALGKLARLEKKPELFKKIFTSNTFSLVDLYFFPKMGEIYYGNVEKLQTVQLPKASEIFFNASNASFFDRLFVFSIFFSRKNNQFKKINFLPIKDGQKNILDGEELSKEIQGFFFKKTFRSEKRQVQIIYTNSYETAYMINQIIEGEGIRVVDLTRVDIENKNCQIIEKGSGTFSKTARSLNAFFGCRLINGSTETSDIIFMLGNLEKEWAVE